MLHVAHVMVLTLSLSVAAVAADWKREDAACSVSSVQVELGKVPWLRDYDAAVAQAKESKKPLLALFQEVPGCATCQNFGKGPLSHPLVVDAARLFVPLCVYNSVKDKDSPDAKLLKKFGERAWNNPVVRFFDSDGKDIAPQLDRNWALEPLLRAMLAALAASKSELPPWLELVRREYARGGSETGVFAMACYWSGDRAFGEVEGVVGTRVGMCQGREVVEVDFDPTVISYAALVEKAKTLKCADTAIVRSPAQAEAAAAAFPGKATVRSDKPVDAKAQQKHYLFQQPAYYYLPLTELQATRANARFAAGRSADDLLSPGQLELKAKLESLVGPDLREAKVRFSVLKPDRSTSGLAAYTARLGDFLAVADQSSGSPNRAVPDAFAGPRDGFSKEVKTGSVGKVAVEGAKDDGAWFHLAVPEGYSPERQWPLMIVLHGGPGGRGPDDIVSFFRGGLTEKGVINVYPNGIKRQLLEWNYPHAGAYLLAIIRQVTRTYRVDPCRIYLVGTSMGGGGAWAQGAVLRDVWAAIGPIAGWYQPSPAPPAEWLKEQRIYCLHGEQDNAVPVSRSHQAVRAMQQLGHKVLELKDLDELNADVKATMIFREVPGGQHNVLVPWDSQGRFELGKMIGWLLTQRRPQPADLDAAEKSLAQWGQKQFDWTPGDVLGTYAEQTVADAGPEAEPASDRRVTELRALEQQIERRFQEKEYVKAEQDCRRMIELAPKFAAAHYNLACVLARQDKKEDALAALEKAVALGQADAAHMQRDDDLAVLRGDPRFAAAVKQARANERQARGAAEKGGVIEGVRTIENEVDDGLRYRLRIGSKATKEHRHRLVVWLHPSGGSMNNAVEAFAPRLAEHGYAVVVFTQKNFAGWSGDDATRLERTLEALGTIEGLDARRPLLLGYSAGGQMALMLWQKDPARWGGLVLDAAYPVDLRGDRPTLQLPPKDADAAKQTPIFVLVGGRDGGARVWQQAEKPYREAGIPLSVEYVEGQGHTWLFGKDQTGRLLDWLDDIAAGKLPSATIGKPVPAAAAGGRPVLGVALDGLKVTQVVPDSPADKAGVNEGDEIASIDGTAVASPEELAAAIAKKKPGDTAKLVLNRDGERIELTASFPAQPPVTR